MKLPHASEVGLGLDITRTSKPRWVALVRLRKAGYGSTVFVVAMVKNTLYVDASHTLKVGEMNSLKALNPATTAGLSTLPLSQ